MKGPSGKSVSGIYSNPRFIHTAASLVGCVMHVQVRNGSMYEGVFRTFSEKVDLVLEMAHKVEKKSTGIAGMLNSRFEPGDMVPKMIFPISDVIIFSAINVDLEQATRDAFTDTAISRFNGARLAQERVLEPWDAGISTCDNLPDLGSDEVSNGWAADEMFKTNEVKYGVKSSFDNDLHDYTIPLSKQNTEEYKQQEAKASKIAQEIENSTHYKNRTALENGDEEERFSAVVRTEAPPNNNNNANNNRFVHRTKKPQVNRPMRSSPSPNAHPNNRVVPPHMQNYHPNKPSPAMQSVTSNVATQPKVPNVKPAAHSLPPRQGSSPHSQTLSSVVQSSVVASSMPPGQVPQPGKVNGDIPRPLKEPPNNDMKASEIPLPVKEVSEKKNIPNKVQDEKAEGLKRFHENFKLADSKDVKGSKEKQLTKVSSSESSESGSESIQNPEKKTAMDKMSDSGEETDSVSESMKNSNLNPNAKEFVFNPNAKSFTPRAPMAGPPAGILQPPMPPPSVQQQAPRLHAQSPVIAMPQAHIMQGMPHTVFNVAPHHYVLPATSMPIAPPYTPATSMAQAPRYRKAMPVSLPRNDSSQSIHVQAATGQPILAPPLSAPQFIQYASSPGILHPTGPPQPPMTYTQMYSVVGQRVLTPQPLSMMQAAAAYGETAHMPTQLYMNPQAVAHASQSNNSGQHSAPSTPQSHTPNLHTAPSPVHQPPPPHSQAQTPTGHPSNPPTPQLVYHPNQLAAQHSLHINTAPSNHNHPYSAIYGGGAQPIMLVPQQAMAGHHPHHPAAFPGMQNHFHAQASGAPTQVQHPPVAMMQSSAPMVVPNNHYVPHSQGAWRKSSIS